MKTETIAIWIVITVVSGIISGMILNKLAGSSCSCGGECTSCAKTSYTPLGI